MDLVGGRDKAGIDMDLVQSATWNVQEPDAVKLTVYLAASIMFEWNKKAYWYCSNFTDKTEKPQQ